MCVYVWAGERVTNVEEAYSLSGDLQGTAKKSVCLHNKRRSGGVCEHPVQWMDDKGTASSMGMLFADSVMSIG